MDTQKRSFCNSEFWNFDLFWLGDSPVLTSCFQNTVLVAVPCGFLWIASVMHFILNKKQKQPPIPPYPWTLLSIGKMLLSSLLLFLACLKLGHILWIDSSSSIPKLPISVFLSASVRITTYGLVLASQVFQRHRREVSSSHLFIFWVLHTICEIGNTPALGIFHSEGDEMDEIQFILGSLNFSLIFCELVLSAFTDPSHNYLKNGKQDFDCLSNQTLLTLLTFAYLDRLVWYAFRNTLTIQDLEFFGSDKTAHPVSERILKQWSKEERKVKRITCARQLSESETQTTCKDSGKPSLFLAIARAIFPTMIISSIMEVMISFTMLIPPLILDLVLQFIDGKEPQWHGYAYAFALFLCSVTLSMLTVNNLHLLVVTSLIPRLGLPAIVYSKSLRLSSAARFDYTIGEMCNLIHVDVHKVFEFVWFANLTWACPFRILISSIFLWQYLGVACLSGFAVMILLIPITGYLARQTQFLQEKQLKMKDSRLRQMNEILNGIKVLKLFAWEVPFCDKIEDIRHKEVVLLRKFAMYRAASVFFWIFAPFLVAVSSFVTFVFMDEDNVLTPSIAFVSLTLFNSLRPTLAQIPDVITKLVQFLISIKRLQKFLLCEELKADSIGNNPTPGNSISVIDGMFSWSSNLPPFLQDIQVAVEDRSLVAIVGPVGSGKSALLTAILGQMYIAKGSVDVKGNIAYVAQQAWIQNATLRSNVLFLKEMSAKKYDTILDLCCLKPDLKVLPAGDLTEIGEKGVNLSGGQKQRVSLARAVYQDSDVYILDDPLSAVDSHVGAHIFTHVIGPNGVMKGKTRILVTHDLSILPDVDQILVMSNGRIVESGKYQDLLENKKDFAMFVAEHLKKAEENDILTSEEETETKDAVILETEKMSTQDIQKQMRRLRSRLSRSLSVKEPEPTPKKIKKTQYSPEGMQLGRVKSGTYISYFRRASFKLSILMIMSYIGYQSLEIGSSFWLSAWSNDVPLSDGSQNIELRNIRIGVYGILGMVQGTCILFATLLLATASMRASELFHSAMLTSVLRTPMLFFDTTPIGRILNRFGSDINTVDIDIPDLLNSFFTAVTTVLGTLVVISISNPLFIAIMIPLSIVYFALQMFYMPASRQIRRLYSVSLSPVLSCFSETVQGTSTIRAFKAQKHFTNREYGFLNANIIAFINSATMNRWLGIRLELIGSVVVFIAALLAVSEKSTLNAGVVGLTLSYALNVSLSLNVLVKQLTTLENRLVSVERVNEYSELTSEAPWKKKADDKVPKEWPMDGAVTFQNYSMAYRENMDLVLREVNLEIKPKEKVGLVGRTGAGKSSLALALFRTVEANGGSITLDRFDIASLGLHTLRSKLTIIPQDPVLFSGPLKMNLDPLQQHSDDDIWNALDHAHLKSFVSSVDGGLDYHVTEGGDNLSLGQCQQLCLARALLKRTKVLILDEATAAMDMETDKLIQSTIRTEFQSSTVITIAHRLHTILDYDRIIVMDNGKIVEHGRPDFLLKNANSYFYQLAKDAGII